MYIPEDREQKIEILLVPNTSNVYKFPDTEHKSSLSSEPETNEHSFVLKENLPTDTHSLKDEQVKPTDLLQAFKDKGRQKEVVSDNFRLDELKEEWFEKYAENHRLVKLIEIEGLSPAAAIKRDGAKRSPRALAYLYKRYQKEGKRALVDRRWYRQPETPVLTESMKNLIFSLKFDVPAAGPSAIRRLIKLEIERVKNNSENGSTVLDPENLRLPAVSTIHEYLKELPEAVKKAETSRGLTEFQKQGAPYLRYENTRNANERWQLDHAKLKIWIRIRVKGKWVAVRVNLTLALDVHSRAIMGFWISTKDPDTWAIKILLYFAIRPKTVKGFRVFGKPNILQCDNGGDYKSIAMKNTASAMGMLLEFDPPYYPNAKGKIERVFHTLDTMLVRALKGHIIDIGVSETSANKRIDELITRDQLKQALEFIVVEYNNTVHSETGRKPQELWEETVIGPILPEEHELNTLLLQYDKQRTIQGFGIRFKLDGEKHLYWHDTFAFHWREKVTIAYHPESLESVFVYDSKGKLICEAWDLRAENPHFTLAHVQKARKEIMSMLRGIRQRTKEYMAEVWEQDRRVEQRKNYITIREKIENEEIEKLPENENENSKNDALRKLFRQQDTKQLNKD